MGSIDKYIFRTALAPIPARVAHALRVARALVGVDPMTGQARMIPTFVGFGTRVIPTFAIGRSNARLPGRPVTA
jgi:hypothetical protein